MLLVAYAMSGTDITYAAMVPAVLSCRMLLWCGTERAYVAMARAGKGRWLDIGAWDGILGTCHSAIR
eukprot:2603533-Rhodomonas_salina.2